MLLSPTRIVAGAAGAGEANSGANVGASGIGVFDSKSGIDLLFRNLNPKSPRIEISVSGSQIDFDVSNSAFAVTGHTHAQTDVTDLVTALASKIQTGVNVGASGVGVFAGTSGASLQFNKINPLSSRVTVALSGSQIDIDVVNSAFSVTGHTHTQSEVADLVTALAAKVATGTSVGASGVAVFESISGTELKLRRLNPNDSKVLISVSGSQVDFALSTSAFATTAGSAQLNASGRVPSANLGFANGASGQFVFLNEAGDYVTAPGAGAGEANIGGNIGASGVGVYNGKSGVELQFRKLNPANATVSVVLSGTQIDLAVVPNAISLQNLTGKATGTQHDFEYTSVNLASLINLTANTYQTGPQINISTGVWMIWGTVTFKGNTATAHQVTAKLWNGSANPPCVTMAAAPSQGTNLRGYLSMTLGPTVVILTTTATWAISVACVGANGAINHIADLNAPTGTAASYIKAMRIG